MRLFALIIVLPLLAWNLGVSRNINQWRKYRVEQSEVKLLESMENVHNTSAKQHEDLLSNGDLLKVFFPEIEKNGLNVDLYIPYTTETRGNTLLRSAEIVLRGEFKSLLAAIHTLEQEITQVSLRSVEFTTANNLRDRETQLRATLIVQQIIRKEQ